MFTFAKKKSSFTSVVKQVGSHPDSEFNAIIPHGVSVLGDMLLENGVNLIIEGHVSGSIKKQPNAVCEGNVTLIINETATITGTIEADVVLLRGTNLVTSIDAKHVVLTKKAKVVGDLTYGDLVIETGSTVEGKLTLKAQEV